jgi:hypothetical protein
MGNYKTHTASNNGGKFYVFKTLEQIIFEALQIMKLLLLFAVLVLLVNQLTKIKIFVFDLIFKITRLPLKAWDRTKSSGSK